jgi:nucleoside-diphosphate-sugar epimerase
MDNQPRKPSMESLHIVVTGCSGSVGYRVVEQALKEGHVVKGVDKVPKIDQPFHPNFTFVAIDLCDFEATMGVLKGCDAVIHLAAFPNPGDFVSTVHNLYVREKVRRWVE